MMGPFKLLATCAGIFLAGFAIPVQAQTDNNSALVAPDEENLAIAREIVDLGFPIETREAVFFATMDQLVAQIRQSSLQAYDLESEENAGIIVILDEWIVEYVDETKVVLRSHIPSLMEGLAASYAVMFTRQELQDIRTFVSSPSGQRYFELGSAVIGEAHFANANQQYMNEVQAQMPAAIAELRIRLEAFVAE